MTNNVYVKKHETFDLEQAAEFLKIHPETLREKVCACEVPAARIGRAYVFLPEDLAEYLRSQYISNLQAVQVTIPEGEN